MGRTTAISWTDSTWNPLRGCSRIAEGCRNCYAERMAARNLPGHRSPTTGKPFAIMTPNGPRWTGKVELIKSQLEAPLHWELGRRVFANSMSDTFHPEVEGEWLDRMFAVMALCPQHTFIIPTKRIELAREYLSKARASVRECIAFDAEGMGAWKQAEAIGGVWVPAQEDNLGRVELEGYYDDLRVDWPLPNVILLASVSNQVDADRDIPILLDTPAAVRGISLEPMIGPVKIPHVEKLGWVIIGSESGPGARPCDWDWIRSVRDQCIAADVRFFLKQWVEKGKKTELPFLDGRQWMEHPEVYHA